MGSSCEWGRAESTYLLSHAASALARLRMLLSRDLGNENDGILLVFPMFNIVHRFTGGSARPVTRAVWLVEGRCEPKQAQTGPGPGPRASGDWWLSEHSRHH